MNGSSYDFDAEYGSNAPQEDQDSGDSIEDAVDREFASLSAPVVEEEPDEDYSQEIDKRLEVASYYQELRRASLFGDTNTEAARIVGREVRRFVQQRLEVLVGMRKGDEPAKPAPAALPFTDLQITALQLFANKLLSGPSVAPIEKKPAEPKLVPVPAPVASVAPTVMPRPVPAPASKPAANGPPQAPKQPAQAPKKKQQKPGTKRQVVIPETGEVREVTVEAGQVRSPEALKPLTAQELSIMSEQQSQQQLSASLTTPGNGATITAALISGALQK